jgi:RNA polymerase sigma-70 factor, ECF subfamily
VAVPSTEWTRQPDVGIVRRAQDGDERAYSVLFRAYQPQVFGFVLRQVRDRSLAEDLTQDVFLRVFQALPRFSFRCKFRTWLFQVARNRVLDEARAQGRGPRRLVALEDVATQEVAQEGMDEPLEQRETTAKILQAIEGLPTDLKTALLLRDVSGLRYTEIADTLDITLASVKWRIFRARDEVVLALVGVEPDATPRSALARRLERLD